MESLANKTLPKPFKDQLNRILDANNSVSNQHASNRRGSGCTRKLASLATQRYRRDRLFHMFGQLWSLGYQLRSPENLATKHVEALVNFWGQQNLAAPTLQTRISILNIFSRWIRKDGIVKSPGEYFPNGEARRTSIAMEDKSWEAMAIDAEKMITEAMALDERFGAMLNLQYQFGLRMKESCEIKPAKVLINGGQTIEIYEGTKGGRLRRIEIDSLKQRQAIDHARLLAAEGQGGRLRWPDCNWKQAKNRFYWFMRKMGLTRAELGVTAHGLRHEFAQGEYENETGLPSPIKGGALGKIDRATHEQACLNVSRKLGHGRVEVTSSYYGSYGHQLRGTNAVMEYKVQFNPGDSNGQRFGV